MTEDNSSVGDDGVITKNVLGSTGSYLESLAVSDSLMANDIVMAAMLDTTVTDFISDEGIVTELPMNEKVVDDSLMAPLDTVSAFLAASEETTADVVATSESVSAFLAASQEAAAAAEAKLSKEESEIVPLIPRSNDTVSVAIQVEPSILPASQVVGEPVTAVPVEINTPDVKKILKFAIPAIGVWLCGPLLSLIDTSAVGLLSGTYQQAALNPAAAVTDYSALLIVRILHFTVLQRSSVSNTNFLVFSLFLIIRHSCTLRPPTWLPLRKRQTMVSRENRVPPRT
jgi:hypothetical protein